MTGFVKSDITCDRKSPIKFGDKVKKACGSYDPKEKCQDFERAGFQVRGGDFGKIVNATKKAQKFASIGKTKTTD